MDSNTIAQLVAALAENNKAAAPVISQNSLLIWTQVISALTPLLAALVIWITKQSSDAKVSSVNEKIDKLEKLPEVVKEIHTDVNSSKSAMAEELRNLRNEVKELTKDKATSDEKQRGHDAALLPQSVVSQIVQAIKESKGT